MSKRRLCWFLGFVALSSVPAIADDCGDCRPYVIEESCDADGYDCVARMRYAPGQSMADDPVGNYWYETPPPDDDYDFEYVELGAPEHGAGGEGWNKFNLVRRELSAD